MYPCNLLRVKISFQINILPILSLKKACEDMIKHEENSQYYMKSQTKGNKKAHPLVNIQAFSILG